MYVCMYVYMYVCIHVCMYVYMYVCMLYVYVYVWRARGDMIEVFKWVKGINKGNIDQFLEISSQDRKPGNRYKLEKLQFRINIGRYWFTNRVVNDWNRLDRHIVNGESIGSFKRRLDESMDRDDRWDG